MYTNNGDMKLLYTTFDSQLLDQNKKAADQTTPRTPTEHRSTEHLRRLQASTLEHMN